MKNRLFKIFLIVILSLNFTSCNNDDDNRENLNLNGTYTGTFTVEYLNGDTFSNPVTVTFSKENYQSSGNDDYFPAGGSGTYDKTISTIEFNDINYWTANFDAHLILGGEYEYSLNGNELIISANRPEFGFYKYELTKE
ncbi:hypothetical protein [Psychroflexus lacisalsi]|uniref:Lipocalin-like domain-containing protein n=1 Tax=Psychroflexus lacisalsi TaxID=503928 RepID=A0ABP3VKY7_9FLAO|nr:hypothetical protein [Psychroflexus lacisalsi]MBZ9621285.1 hypothetical protein [Psychroflexus lacisalsi]